MKTLTKYIIVFLLLIVGYVLLGLSSWSLPDSQIKNAISKSVSMGDIDSDYPRAIVNKEMCRMDNCTDALILNQTYNMRLMSPLTSVMLVPSLGGETRNVESLNNVVDGVSQPIQTYARYWHGSTFLMRFLTLVIGRYANIRLILYYCTSLLLLLLSLLLYKHTGWKTTVAFALGFLLLKGYVTQFSIQFFPVITLALGGAIMVIHYRSSISRIGMTLFVLGSLTAFFDLLTTPLLTLGLPLLFYLACKEENITNSRWITTFKTLPIPAILWALGYGVTWAIKWALATCFTSTNVFKDAFSVGAYRIGGDVPYIADYNLWDTIVSNVDKMPILPIIGIIVLFLICICIAPKWNAWKIASFYLLISITPYLWYCILSNHSIVHCWFTYRIQLITVIAVFMAEMSLINWPLFFEKVRLKKKAVS